MLGRAVGAKNRLRRAHIRVALDNLTAARRRRRCTLADPAGRLHGRCGAARRPGRCAGGQGGALQVARRRLAARNRRTPLPARRLLGCGGLDPADVGAALHGGQRRARCSTPPPTAPAGCCPRRPRRRVRDRVAWAQRLRVPGPPTPSLSLVDGS